MAEFQAPQPQPVQQAFQLPQHLWLQYQNQNEMLIEKEFMALNVGIFKNSSRNLKFILFIAMCYRVFMYLFHSQVLFTATKNPLPIFISQLIPKHALSLFMHMHEMLQFFLAIITLILISLSYQVI